MKKPQLYGPPPAKKNVLKHTETAPPTALTKSNKSPINWKYVRWAIATLMCIIFVSGLAGYAEYTKRHPAPLPVKTAVIGPQCTFVSTYEVKDAAGKVVSHRSQNQQGGCVAKEQKPFEFPLWAKILFFTFVAVVCLCGGWEILFIFMW